METTVIHDVHAYVVDTTKLYKLQPSMTLILTLYFFATKRRFPKSWVPFWEVPIIRTIVFWGLFGVPQFWETTP